MKQNGKPTVHSGNGGASLLDTDTAVGQGNKKTIPFVNPATGEQFGAVAEATAKEIHTACREMGAAAEIWAAKPVKDRAHILRKLQEVIVDSLDEITAVINQDHGKSRQEALIEIFMTLEKLQLYLAKAPEWLGEREISGGLTFLLSLSREYHAEYMPFGVIGVIGPWNYPFELVVPAVCSALLAGNTVLVKPSEISAATGVMIEKLFYRVPELTPFVRFLHGGSDVGKELVQSRPDLLFLTGSVATGYAVAQATAELMIPFLCELGGKDPMIVLEDADIKAAAKWGIWGGAAFNTGQSCVSVERVYAVREIYDELLEEMIIEARKQSVGYSPDKSSFFDMGPLSCDLQIDVIEEHLQDALDKGAKIVYGGTIDGMFMEPTIVVNVDHTMKLMTHETFGPVIPIMQVDDENHAIQLANDSKFGLGAYLWSGNEQRAQRIAHQLQVGVVNINDVLANYAVAELPFGGVKLSGNARTHGKEEVMQFAQPRSWSVGPPPLAFDPTTIIRQPNRYGMVKGMTQVFFGVTPQQRLQPATEVWEKLERPAKAGLITGAAALAAGAIGLFVGLARLFTRPRKT